MDRRCYTLKENYDEIYEDALSILRAKDLSITNFELPLTSSNLPTGKTGPNLKFSPL